MSLLLGCIADDFTGATDLASMLVRHGMATVQLIDVPAAELDTGDAQAVVVALKSRTVPAGEAVAQSCGILEAKRATQVADPCAERGQRRVDVVGVVSLESARRAPGRPPSGQRAERRGVGGRRPAASATAQVEVPVRSRAARVRRRAELAEKP